MTYLAEQADALLFHLAHIGGMHTWEQSDVFSHADPATVAALVESAATFAKTRLIPLAASGDRDGCTLLDGQVRLPPGTVAAFQEWIDLGFPALGLPPQIDGLGLPHAVQSAVQELCDGANLALGMLFINLRCAALALMASATAEQQARWMPGLVAGTLASTIVISEPQAGSDVGRIRTLAVPQADGTYVLNGSKIWISYADHDATQEILHLVLARLPNSEAGSRGLSLFAVPKILNGNANGAQVLRLEHKMGLHASPTCVLEFSNARAELVGEVGRGLNALFVMMNAMRLAVAMQGAAVANAATLQAWHYAAERPQGGHPLAPAIPIIQHLDVQRQLLEMTADSELARALALRIAALLDKAEILHASGDAQAHDVQQLAEFLLPIAKTCNAETGFSVASSGIQVLGGYGYTSDYPFERLARDIRVASIYEGTSGIQALDLQKRKLIADQAETFNALLALIDEALAAGESPFTVAWPAVKQRLQNRVSALLSFDKAQAQQAESGAYALLQLCAIATHCWNGHTLYVAASGTNTHQQRLRAALQYYSGSIEGKAALWAQKAAQEIPTFPQDK
jgi:alkylation response protein AidB-like acyl-CoA dehydrogenase